MTVTGRDWKPLEPLRPSGRSVKKEVSGQTCPAHGIAFAWQLLPCTCLVNHCPPSAR